MDVWGMHGSLLSKLENLVLRLKEDMLRKHYAQQLYLWK